MLERHVLTQRWALQLNSAPDIETTWHTVLRLWRNGTSSNRYSENRDFTVYFKIIKVDTCTLRENCNSRKSINWIVTPVALVAKYWSVRLSMFQKETSDELRRSPNPQQTNRIDLLRTYLYCVTARNFLNSGRRRWRSFRSIYLLLPAPPLPSLPSRIATPSIYMLHLLSGLRLRSTNVCFTSNMFREKWGIPFSSQ